MQVHSPTADHNTVTSPACASILKAKDKAGARENDNKQPESQPLALPWGFWGKKKFPLVAAE